MSEAISEDAYKSVTTLLVDATRDHENAKALLLRKAKAIGASQRSIDVAKHQAATLIRDAEAAYDESRQHFHAQQAFVEKMASRVDTLRDLISQNEIEKHPLRAEADAWLQGHADYSLGLEQTDGSIKVYFAQRYIGQVVRVRPYRDWTYTFAPYRCLEMKAIGPFDTVEEALTAATTVTPYEPEQHTSAALGAEVEEFNRDHPDSYPMGTVTPALQRLNEYDAAAVALKEA